MSRVLISWCLDPRYGRSSRHRLSITAIDAVKGCEGKNAAAFCTHGGRPGQTDETFRRWIEARGMTLSAVADINMKDIENEKKTKELVSLLIRNHNHV